MSGTVSVTTLTEEQAIEANATEARLARQLPAWPQRQWRAGDEVVQLPVHPGWLKILEQLDGG